MREFNRVLDDGGFWVKDRRRTSAGAGRAGQREGHRTGHPVEQGVGEDPRGCGGV